ncbi:MAG: hypothetical protein A2666_03400 [Parcubacteria group bacterium RIFCSPHIGHO2_01_FULL_47_10b]|nr:MAG: hypothetical protein A2666_03400 [Parcubacteria group bacterium RIFCSPHIGHO2_01_FULL_47_10b]
MKIDQRQFENFLLDTSLVGESELKQLKEEALVNKERLEDLLVQKGIITSERLTKVKAYILGIPFIDLEKETIEPAILTIIPEAIARKHGIVAYDKSGDQLEVAMLDPEDLQTIEFIKKKTELQIVPRLTTLDSIKAALKQYQKTLEAEFGEMIKSDTGVAVEGDVARKDVLASMKTTTGKELGEGVDESEEPKAGKLKQSAEELPIIRIIDTLLKHAILEDASDIHIEPMEQQVVVRYRIDGILHDAMTLPKRVQDGLVARIKVLSNLKIDEHRLPQDGRFKIEADEYKVSFRVSILPVYGGEKIVMRLLREGSKGYTLEDLGYQGESLERIHRNINKPHGMVLVTGPTGSGKTTTLYTVLDILNTAEVNISTIEDPIEYRMPRINQTQVRPEIGMTFAAGLRALLRQDPDIIMVGEIRDKETASLAIHAALTGHLVLSTLHTNSAAGALPRLVDMGAEGFLLASTVNVIVAQRLVRKLCTEGKEKHQLTKAELENLRTILPLDAMKTHLLKRGVMKKDMDWGEIPFYRAKASDNCPDGYKGRIGIYEVLEVTEKMRELINKEATTDEIQKLATEEGMVTMLEDGMSKAVQGMTSIEEIIKATQE